MARRGTPKSDVFSVHQKDTKDFFETFTRVQRSEAFSDFTIHCQSKTFRTHRAVLVAHSTYFHSLLLDHSGNERSPLASEATLDSIEPDTLQLILNYMYSGCVTNVPETKAKSLRDGAVKLGIKELVNKSKKLLKLMNRTPTPENCMDGWKTSMELKDDHLGEKFSQIALTHFSRVTTCPSFMDHDLNLIKMYLGHRDLQVDSADLIIHVALDWVRADLTERLAHLPDLLKSIPLDAMDINVLECLMQGEPMFRQHGESRTILQEAISQRGVSAAVGVSMATPGHAPLMDSRPSRVAVTWWRSKTIKLYDTSLREEIGVISAPSHITNVKSTGCCMTPEHFFLCGGKTLYSCHLATNQWRVRGQLKYAHLYPALTAMSGKVYIFGGLGAVDQEVGQVEVWDLTSESLSQAGQLVGEKTGGMSNYPSCCRVSDTAVAVWGLKDMYGCLTLQVYSTTSQAVTHTLRVHGESMGRDVICVNNHVIACDSKNVYVVSLSDVYSETSAAFRRLNNFRFLYYDALIVSEDGQTITALCYGQHVLTAAVNDVITDAACGWREVPVTWTHDKDWCMPGAVCTSYSTQR